MPEEKEPHYFGCDLSKRPGFPYYAMDEKKYLSLFAEGAHFKRVGEASVYYLVSTRAASEIKEFSPSAKIIIMLRNPIDMMNSLHSHHVYTASEDIESFALALEVEDDRKLGMRIPKSRGLVDGLFYRHVAKYAEQVQTYFKVFGRQNVHVIIFDDFRNDTPGVYAQTLRFLDVNPEFRPDFSIINDNRRARSGILRYIWANRPPILQRVLLDRINPSPPRRLLISALQWIYRRPAPRLPLDPELRRRLQAEFKEEVVQLSRLLGRDLTHWCRE